MEKAAKAQECERWKYIGIASHYFFDSKCFWHQVTNENYSNCHKPFEDQAGDVFNYTGVTVRRRLGFTSSILHFYRSLSLLFTLAPYMPRSACVSEPSGGSSQPAPET